MLLSALGSRQGRRAKQTIQPVEGMGVEAMSQADRAAKQPRTLLGQLIRDRHLTFEEFAQYAETFARDHDEVGTLSVRHLQRLAAGRNPDGRPLGRVRPATARLLERIFGTSIDKLLSSPLRQVDDDSAAELRQRLDTSRRVDKAIIDLLHEQLTNIRRLDRQLGAPVVYDEVGTKIAQVTGLSSYCLSPDIRANLATLLAELCMLAGWQALDIRNSTESWQYYEQAKAAATESGSTTFRAHTTAQQAFVLIDIDKPADAADLLANSRAQADKCSPPLLRSWLAAAHGEALAANGQRAESLNAFDSAAALLPNNTTKVDGPYVVLDATHLARWRGHALARLGDAKAIDVLTSALTDLDPSFTRAETALRTDLATAFVALGEPDAAKEHATMAGDLAAEIGSARQQRRLRLLSGAAL